MSNNQYKSFVPAIPDDVLAPPPIPQPEAPLVRDRVDSSGAWFIITLAIVLVTLILIIGMIVDGSAAKHAINQGVKVFLTAMGLVVFVLSGTLTDIVRGAQREKTERARIAAWADLGEQAIRWRQSVEDNRRMEILRASLPSDMAERLARVETRLLDVMALRPPEANDGRVSSGGAQRGDTWVTPYDNRGAGPFDREMQPTRDTTRDEALRWARGLYLETNGEPNPDAVWLTNKPHSHGKLRGRMIGSARDKDGSEAAGQWLMDREIITVTRAGHCLNLAKFPRLDTLYYVE